jgi:dCTP deaminase
MSIQSDNEIVGLLEAKPPILNNFSPPADWYAKESLAQPASLDLHVGVVFVPPKKEPRIGQQVDKREEYTLEPGQAIVVDTTESLNFPKDIAAFGFPPTTISNRAILMTNPGHIDPGFKGKLNFTLINMGRESFSVKTGMVVATLLVIKLANPPTKDFSQRHPSFQQADPTVRELYRLGRDFLDLEQRARRVAGTVVRRNGIGLTLLTATLTGVLAFGAAWFQSNGEIAALKVKISALENQAKIESRLQDIETKLGNLSSNASTNINANYSQNQRGKKKRGKKR